MVIFCQKRGTIIPLSMAKVCLFIFVILKFSMAIKIMFKLHFIYCKSVFLHLEVELAKFLDSCVGR